MPEERSSSASSGKPAVTAPRDERIHQTPPSAAICILLVEDDHVLRAVSADTLGDLGYRAIRASNGTQALAALDGEPDIRILMTDVGLPGMDGRQLAAEARRRRPDIGILFVTGYDDMVRNAGPLREQGFECLAKPYGYEDLARILQRLVSAKRS
jgi:CheY-like chemotaxis protein